MSSVNKNKKQSQEPASSTQSWLKENCAKVDSPTLIKKYSTPHKSGSITDTQTNAFSHIQNLSSFDSKSLQRNPSKIKSTGKEIKLPSIMRKSKESQETLNQSNPESKLPSYYQQKLYRILKNGDISAEGNAHKRHFFETIEAIKMGKFMKFPTPTKQLKLEQKNPGRKTIYLDLDETLVHCEEKPSKNSVKLNFPVVGGMITAGIRIRPFCKQFLEELSKVAQIIIFTASSKSYADVVLNYLDPEKKYISHRLYRESCSVVKGIFVKDLRIVNRKLSDCVLVDNLGFCFLAQPSNGIPIIPFYNNPKDSELQDLLQLLKKLIEYDDMRVPLRKKFFFNNYNKESAKQPKTVFMEYFEE